VTFVRSHQPSTSRKIIEDFSRPLTTPRAGADTYRMQEPSCHRVTVPSKPCGTPAPGPLTWACSLVSHAGYAVEPTR
jgi:hypothetical protein